MVGCASSTRFDRRVEKTPFGEWALDQILPLGPADQTRYGSLYPAWTRLTARVAARPAVPRVLEHKGINLD